MRLDITTQKNVIEVKSHLFNCPYCGKGVRETQRMNYPVKAVGAFATVYRCGCGKFIGAPNNTSS
jgi:hypothetical protein